MSSVQTCGHHHLAVGGKLRAGGLASWPRKTCNSPPLAASHRRAVLSLLAVTTVLPSGENCALLTDPHGRARPAVPCRWPHPTGARVIFEKLAPTCGHHRLAIGRKLGAIHTHPHGRAIPAVPCPLAASHRRAVLSQLAVTTVLPSGENCALLTKPSWPRKTCKFPSAGRIPQASRLVSTCGHHCLATTEKV